MTIRGFAYLTNSSSSSKLFRTRCAVCSPRSVTLDCDCNHRPGASTNFYLMSNQNFELFRVCYEMHVMRVGQSGRIFFRDTHSFPLPQESRQTGDLPIPKVVGLSELRLFAAYHS